MYKSYKIAPYTVMHTVHGHAKCRRWWYYTTSGSCPPCWKCANMIAWAYTMVYSCAANSIQSFYLLTLHACIIIIQACSGKIRFPTYKSSLYWPVAKNRKYRYKDAVTCFRSPSYSMTIYQKRSYSAGKWMRFFTNHPGGKLPPFARY